MISKIKNFLRKYPAIVVLLVIVLLLVAAGVVALLRMNNSGKEQTVVNTKSSRATDVGRTKQNPLSDEAQSEDGEKSADETAKKTETENKPAQPTPVENNGTSTPAPTPTPTPSVPPAQRPVIFSDSFESGGSSLWRRETAGLSHSLDISSQAASDGVNSLRVELCRDDPDSYGSKRSELTLRITELEAPLLYNTYNAGVMLPSGGSEDYQDDPSSPEIIIQWHNWPDPGEAWTNPPLSLHTENGRYILRRVWDDASMSTSERLRAKGFNAQHDLGSYAGDKGKFVNWRFNIKWGWLASHNPRIEVYKDGVNVLNVDGPNTTNDQKGNYFKIGVYKWDWKDNSRSILSSRVVYYDNIVVW